MKGIHLVKREEGRLDKLKLHTRRENAETKDVARRSLVSQVGLTISAATISPKEKEESSEKSRRVMVGIPRAQNARPGRGHTSLYQ